MARRQLNERDVAEATIELLGIGYAPAARDGLKARLIKEGFSPALLADPDWSFSVTTGRSPTGSETA